MAYVCLSLLLRGEEMLLRAGDGALSTGYDKRLGWVDTDTAAVVAQPSARWLALQSLLGCCSRSCIGAGTKVQAPVGVLGWWQPLMLWKKRMLFLQSGSTAVTGQ